MSAHTESWIKFNGSDSATYFIHRHSPIVDQPWIEKKGAIFSTPTNILQVISIRQSLEKSGRSEEIKKEVTNLNVFS